MTIQLDFFRTEEEEESDLLRKEMQKVKESSDKVRKSLFARHNELAKEFLQLHHRMEVIERNICRK